jgi:hypothetical protein
MKRRLQVSMFLTALVLASSPVRTQATVLTFDINDATDTSVITAESSLISGPHAAYGDNVSSATMSAGSFTYHYGSLWGFTPDITVSYSAGTGAASTYYHGDPIEWPGADYLDSTAGGSSRLFYWTFTPASGKGVRINSFELFAYSIGSGSHAGTWTIYKDSTSGVVLDSGAFSFAASAPTLYGTPFVVNTAQLDYMGTLVLEVNHTTGGTGSFALDDLAFNQEIPEPAAAAMLAVGGVTMLWRRRGVR